MGYRLKIFSENERKIELAETWRMYRTEYGGHEREKDFDFRVGERPEMTFKGTYVDWR